MFHYLDEVDTLDDDDVDDDVDTELEVDTLKIKEKLLFQNRLNCVERNVLFNKQFFSLIKLRHFGNLV